MFASNLQACLYGSYCKSYITFTFMHVEFLLVYLLSRLENTCYSCSSPMVMACTMFEAQSTILWRTNPSASRYMKEKE
uniref:Uncharacterized protein n=1 Tax=Nelumbo nucifera TaxID=4432 RepID=A0A822YEK4_NELNU|nr:TPA_asm: hypothetical protein HUJ06_009778 [Nelumbo nucifera]